MAKILVIDDEPQMRDMLKQLLQLDGHHVTLASNGDEGIACFNKSQPDLVITDILMPYKDGIELVIEIRRIDTETPIIATSGGRRSLSASFNLDSSLLVGANTMLPKPFTRAQLQASVKKCLP